MIVGEALKQNTCYPYTYYPESPLLGAGLISHATGTNFLFMDKHVEYRKYPSKIPPNLVTNADYKTFWAGYN
jgi:hypothetical protein